MKKREKSRIMTESSKILKGTYKQFSWKLITSICVRGLLLWIPILYSDAIDWVSKSNFEKAFQLIVISLIVTLIYYVAEWINQYAYWTLYNKLYKRYSRLATYSTFQNSIYSLSRFSLGEYANILNNDVDVICSFYSNGVIRLVQVLEFFIIYSYFFSLDIYIFLITIVISIFMVAVFIVNGKKIQKYNAIRKGTLDDKTATVHEVFLGIKEIKGFHVFQNINDRVKQKCRKYVNAAAKYDNYVVCTKLAVQAIIQVARLSLVFYGIYLISEGKMELGVVMLIYTYYQKIIDNFGTISTINVEYRNLKVSLNRFNKILEYSQDPIEISQLQSPIYSGMIRFDDVLYGNKNDPILNFASFEMKASQINVITGKAGSGKTGIFDLLLKMNRPHSGLITIDEVPIDQIDGQTYYNLISVVRKQPIFFDLSIKDNLMLIESDFEKIVEICKLLNIHDYIVALSHGYDTPIHSKEENISNNVKNLLAIARVLLKDSKIMLFDECISILEKESQEVVLDLLEKLKEDHTIIIISREKEITMRADHIIVVDHNNIVECGSHKQLMKQKQYYYELYSS